MLNRSAPSNLAANFRELNRRGFLLGSAAALASGLASCGPLEYRLGARSGRAQRTCVGAHRTYDGFLASLRLRRIPVEMVLAPHGRTVRGVSNSLPPRKLWSDISPTLQVADKIAARLDSELVEINSAYRNPRYNRRVGGSSGSQHMLNTALDLKFACGPSKASKVARQLRDEGYFSGGIGIYRTFVHIDTRGTDETWCG